MVNFRNYVSIIGATARDVLAIAGLVGLLWTVYSFWDKPFEKTIEKYLKPEIKVRPIHEELITTKSIKYTDGTPAKYKLMGLHIKNDKDVSDLRIKIKNISAIDRWSLSSTGISPEDAKSVVSTLPSGITKNKDVFLTLPRIMANSETILQFQGVTIPKFEPSSEWFTVSSGTSGVYHMLYPETYGIREMSFKFEGPSFYKVFFFAFNVPLLGYILYRRARIKLAEKPQSEPIET